MELTKKNKELYDLYKFKWDSNLSDLRIPEDISQEQLTEILTLVLQTGESLMTGASKVCTDKK